MVDGQQFEALRLEVQQRPHLVAGLHAEPDRAVRRILDRPNPAHPTIPPRQDAARLFRQAGPDVIQHGMPVFVRNEQAIRQGHRRALYRLLGRFRSGDVSLTARRDHLTARAGPIAVDRLAAPQALAAAAFSLRPSSHSASTACGAISLERGAGRRPEAACRNVAPAPKTAGLIS